MNSETVKRAFTALIIVGLILSFATCSLHEIAKDVRPPVHTGP